MTDVLPSTQPSYPAARAVAPKIHAYFARHIAESQRRGAPQGSRVPETDAIEAMIDRAFWASLRREEGYVPKISLALLPPEEAAHPLLFERPLALGPTALTRIAPAVERPGIHLGVWRDNGELRVWGTTWSIPSNSFVLEVTAPGLLVVKHERDGGGKFVNVAVLEGDQIKIVDERASRVPDCPSLITSLLGFGQTGGGPVDVLVELAVSMRAHGRGGILLMVPSDGDQWRESIVGPVAYSVAPAFPRLTELVRQTRENPDSVAWRDALAEAVAAVAGLTAVDGATVLTDRYGLVAFGVKIARRKGSVPVERTMVTEPIEGGTPDIVHPMRLGGTRHLSAAQFVHDQRDTLALVASQDGRFTVFSWSSCEDLVHAHRVEVLLM
jgi:hypothetical protein